MVLLIIWVCISQLYLSYTCECLDGPPHGLRDRGIASVGNVLFRKITQTVIETVRTRSDSFERFCSPSKNEHSHPNKHEKQPKFFVTALHCVSDCLSSRVTWLWWRWTRWKLGQMSDVKKSAEFNWKCKDVFIPWWSHTILKKWAPNCNMFKSWVKTWRPIERLASLKILMILAILRTCSRKL